MSKRQPWGLRLSLSSRGLQCGTPTGSHFLGEAPRTACYPHQSYPQCHPRPALHDGGRTARIHCSNCHTPWHNMGITPPHIQSKRKELTGRLNHIAFSAPWLKYLLGNIYSSLATALCLNNSHLLCTSQHFFNALCILHTVPLSKDGYTMQTFHDSANAKFVHSCTLLHHISVNLRWAF